MNTRSNRQKQLDKNRQAAMPEVKKLVKKFSRQTIGWCLNQLKEYEKKVEQLSELKREAQKLEREIG